MSLQVWLPLNGNLNNYGLNGNIVSTATGTTIISAGKIGPCYQFGTAISYITIPKEAMTSFTTEASVCFWLKIISWNTSYETYFQAGLGSTPWAHYIFGFLRNNTASTCCFTISNGSSASNASYITPAFDLNKWYHVALVYKTGHCLIYIDGQLYQDYTTSIVPNFSGITTITTGICNNKSNYQTNCQMNDIRIYNHALSPKEVKEIAKGLVLHYKLDNNGLGNPNLLPCSGQYLINSPWSTTLNRTDGYAWVTNSAFEASPSTTYTISVQCDGTLSNAHNAGSLSISDKPWSYWLYISNTGTSKNWQAGQYDRALNLTSANNNYRKIGNTHVWTVTLASTEQYISIRTNSYSDGNTNLTINWWNMKVEKGAEFSGWSPYLTNTNIIYDVSGYNRAATANAITWSSPSPRYNTAAHFNGTDSYIRVPFNEACPDNIFTINLWFKKDALGSKGYETLFGGPSGFEMDTRAGNATTLSLYMASARGGNVFSPFNLGEWYMVTMVRDGTNELYYVNGELKKTIEAKTMPTGIYRIGAWSSDTGQSYYGEISDFRVYNTPLIANDIKELYHTSASIDSNGNIHAREVIEV